VLKKWLGDETPVQAHLPTIDDEFVLPQAVLERRIQKGVQELLVHWRGRTPADATWENLTDFQLRFPTFFLEDKDISQQEGVLRVPHTKAGKKESESHGKESLLSKESQELHNMAKEGKILRGEGSG
jgi:hypothetical protein